MAVEHKNIYEAILGVMEDVQYAQKTGKFDGGRTQYSYASEYDLLMALRPAMVKHGIVVFPENIDNLSITQEERKQGGFQTRMSSTMQFRFTHASTETFFTATVSTAGIDVGDKYGFKANTGALKYALRMVFLLPTGDDPDAQLSEEQEAGRAAEKPVRKSKAKPAEPKKKAAAPVKAPPKEIMDKALEYVVPDGYLLQGSKLGEALEHEMGVYIIMFLAGEWSDPQSEMFKPVGEELEKLHKAAKIIKQHHPDFAGQLEKFVEQHPELMQQ